VRRGDRLIGRRIAQAAFRDAGKTIDTFDFDFNKKMDRKTIFNLATSSLVHAHEDVLLLGPPGTGKSHLAQALGLPVP
jgi:DNA replication protein DnaC